MNKSINQLSLTAIAAGVLLASGCDNAPKSRAAEVKPSAAASGTQSANQVLPASDPTNQGGWVLNEMVSDEFNGDSLDKDKWFVEGENGDYYIWKGRAPSQFAPHNVKVSDGKLQLISQWEPDYPFAYGEGHEGKDYGEHEGQKVPVTTAAVVGKKRFLNGYMEVRTKAANAAMTSSFWAIGYQQELDVYEQMGRPTGDGPLDIKGDTLKASIHDWQPPAQRPTRKFGHKTKLDFSVAEDFHVYGAEWGEDYIRFYLNGELISESTQEEVGEHWVLTNPMEVWLDSEIFVWLGLPTPEQLPATYEVDYVRVWQQPQTNLLDRAFYGFEGPILYEENPRPLDLVPENSENNNYQKFWAIDDESAKSLQRVRNEQFAKGTWSLKYTGGNGVKAKAVAPEGSLRVPAGEYEFSAQVWLAPEATAEQIAFTLNGEETAIAQFDLADVARGEWVKVSQLFDYANASVSDFIQIAVNDTENGKGVLYVDDIAVEKK
ncbi:family 16 glycosylhydrolase [Microbulbifer mangrovi]|uniref:family 16 glycosylhydrolase n=1 Tax=Microbulbifer mangrovi TaxID=927787 RepID=UPI001EFBEA1A|nr:family 16 glycosylhydrolase [Microbulbifer mangrovi]